MANRFVLLVKLATGISKIQAAINKGEPAMKWLPSVFSLASMVLAGLDPAIQHYVSAHPLVGVVIGGIATIVAHFSPSPTTPAQ
jgi:hypothetical protein